MQKFGNLQLMAILRPRIPQEITKTGDRPRFSSTPKPKTVQFSNKLKRGLSPVLPRSNGLLHIVWSDTQPQAGFLELAECLYIPL
jgi:hypothetical protein